MVSFKEFFYNEDVIIFDGAIGTYIYSKGIPKGHCYDELNVSMPSIIEGIHEEYINSGAEVITTNTFGANRFILDEYFALGEKTREINYYGARIAKKVSKGRVFVAGSIGPVSRPLDKEKKLTHDEKKELFREQIEALLEGGVDLLIFETHFSADELFIGVKTAKEIDSDVFVIAEMSFPNNGLTISGCTPFDFVKKLRDSQSDVLGANCGTGPQNVYEAIKKIANSYEGELSAMPNAGLARFYGGKFYYPFNPDYFSKYGEKLIKAGVKIVGGCCGTTPEHIKFLKNRVKGLKPSKRKVKVIVYETEKKVKVEEEINSGLYKKLKKGEKIISVEIDPPRDINIEKIIKKLKPHIENVDAFNVSDSPMAKARMSAIATGKILFERFKKEIVIHYTARDRNILGIQSDLIGAYALGIKNVLALGGDPPSIGDYPFATGVYDLTSEGLIELLSKLNRGMDLLGNKVGLKTGYFIGSGLGLGGENEIKIVEAKKRKGAHFFMTQPVYEWEGIIDLIKEIKKRDVYVIVSIMPIISYKNAEYLHYEVPGIEVGEKILKMFSEASKDEYEELGIKISKDVISGLWDHVDGFLIIPQGYRFSTIQKIFKY